MPYKRTGRPPGRPKTKEYVTLSARVPQDQADQVGRYATRHRQTLSEVMRDGFTLLLQEDRYAPFVSDTNGTPENVSDNIPTATEILSDTNGTQEILSDALHMQRLREIVSDTMSTEPAQEILSDMNGALDVEDMPREPVTIPVQPVLDYDPHKYRLGSPCQAAGHLSHGDRNLRGIMSGVCVACAEEKKATKAAQPAPSAPLDLDALPLSVDIPLQPAVSPRVSTLGDKAAVLAQLDVWKSEGLSLQAMADHLNAAHVPTFSGKGHWRKGTIGNMLAGRPAPTTKDD
jgi:hypothetical protein